MNNELLNRIGVIVIGRNEGERLRECLKSVSDQCGQLVYVDSGSSDHSVSIAKKLGCEVVLLDMQTPFSAARARNAGVEKLTDMYPHVQLVQFIDGDCTIEAVWLAAASDYLSAHSNVAAVIGHVFEKYPNKTVFNRLCMLEWKGAAGEIKNFGGFGGISMVKISLFKSVGGFNPSVIAGEDSELGVRFKLNGYCVVKIDTPMVVHDADMSRFNQWWSRSVRAGHAIGQRAHLNGKTAVRDCVHERNSTLVWGFGVPTFILLTLVQTNGLSAIVSGMYLVLGFRVFKYRKNLGDHNNDAMLYSGFTVIGKFANAIGLVKFYLNKAKGRYDLIEYK